MDRCNGQLVVECFLYLFMFLSVKSYRACEIECCVSHTGKYIEINFFLATTMLPK